MGKLKSKLSTLNSKLKRGFTLISKACERSSIVKIKGFTLIELLVVITIIAILATAALYNLIPEALKKGRDTERKANLKQYQTALENYANNNFTLYPSAPAQIDVNLLCANANDPLKSYVSNCINDKKNSNNNSFTYSYASDTLKWTLDAKLEFNNKYWVVCSNGKSGEVSSQPNIANGACPL